MLVEEDGDHRDPRWELRASFFVPGIPKPQGSKRAFVNPKTNRAVVVEDNTKTHDWRSDVRAMAYDYSDSRISDGPVRLELEFVMRRPVSTPKTKPTPHAVKKPDLDKLVRAILDALTGILFSDDSQVTGITAHKRIAEVDEMPGCRIVMLGAPEHTA